METTQDKNDNGHLVIAGGSSVTDADIDNLARLHVQAYMQAYSSHDYVHAIIAVRELLERVRNAAANGHIAPSAGKCLSVDEVIRIVYEWDDRVIQGFRNEHMAQSGDEIEADLRSRLEAKSKHP